MYVCMYVCIYLAPMSQGECYIRSMFKRDTVNLSFLSSLVATNKLNSSICPNIYSELGAGTNKFMPSPRALVRTETQSASYM